MIVSPAFTNALSRLILLASLALYWSACSQLGESAVDEERESHFVAGKTKVTNLDYKGAAEAFEKALEVNPRSAAAHFELGLLCEERINDYAAAIYHYEKHLQLRPNSKFADMVRDRVRSCKMELAKSVPFSLINGKVQGTLEKLNAENVSLRQEVEALKARLAQVSSLTNRSAGALANITPIHPPPSAPQVSANHNRSAAAPDARRHEPSSAHNSSPPDHRQPARASTPVQRARTNPRAPPSSPVVRVLKPHAVRAQDTLATIARQYGISTRDVLAANPGLRAENLRPGQTIHVPVPRQ